MSGPRAWRRQTSRSRRRLRRPPPLANFCDAWSELRREPADSAIGRENGKTGGSVLYVLALVAVVVGVDVLFVRNRFWERLMVNVGIVLVFGAFYLEGS